MILLLAALVVGAAGWFGWNRTAALPGFLMSLLYLGFAVVGGPLWIWARTDSAAGLPASLPVDARLSSAGTAAFACAATGAAVGALLANRCWADHLPLAESREILTSPRVAAGAQIASAVTFVMWLGGQGPSVLNRQVYLDIDGSHALLAVTNIAGPIIGVLALIVGLVSSDRRTQLISASLAAAWWVVSASVGTRYSVAFPLVAGVGLLARGVGGRTTKSTVLGVIAFVVGVLASIYTFGVAYVVRGMPHGLLNLPAVLGSSQLPTLDPQSWVAPLKWVVSSVTASFPVTDRSVSFAPPWQLLANNLNPAPSFLHQVDAFNFERLRPYVWVPLSFVGEAYGSFGYVACALSFAAFTFTIGAGAVYVQRRGVGPAAAAMALLCLFFAVFSVQYSSRSVGRIGSFVLVVPLLVWVATLLRDRRVPQANYAAKHRGLDRAGAR